MKQQVVSMTWWVQTVEGILFAVSLVAVACSGGNEDSTDGGTDSDRDADTGSDGEGPESLGETFRYGINGGHRNANWGDDVQAGLEAAAGCNSQRISLPERHLDRWGYEIEVGDMQAYAELGMADQVAFLTSPIREHSTAPADAEEWELAYYLPANLYETVVLEDGSINPNNFWGKYVYDTVSIYKEWIKVWEIWNEPDYVSDWNATLTWHKNPPTAESLIRFNGSIFEYVRMLRVSREAARLADSEALIATGGIGYASFLSALLRYTDNPEDGSVTDAYPKTGGAYFDVLSFHHYPIYTGGNADDGVAGYLEHVDALREELDAAGKTVAGFENTETGAPHLEVGGNPGGAAYAREYLMKVMVSAQDVGIHGIDWFVLSDGALPGESDSPYAYMGLYEDVVDLATADQAIKTDTGIAYTTLGSLLGGAVVDRERTDAFSLSDGIEGTAFRTADGKIAFALWTVDGGSGAPDDIVEVPSDSDVTAYAWDASETGDSVVITAKDGKVALPITGDVTIFIAQP